MPTRRTLSFWLQAPETQSISFCLLTLVACVLLRWLAQMSWISTLIVLGVGLLFSKGVAAGRRFPTYVKPRNLKGHRVLITGGSKGIGAEVTRRLIQWGAEVVIVSRNPTSEFDHLGAECIPLDISSLDQIRNFVQKWGKRPSTEQGIDLIIHNAALFQPDNKSTPEGIPLSFATNYVGPFYLNKMLLPFLHQDGRVVHVACAQLDELTTNEWPFAPGTHSPLEIYQLSKLALFYYTKSLQDRMTTLAPKKNLSTCAVHPGIVRTPLGRTLARPSILYNFYSRLFCKSPYQGAQTILFCVAAPTEELEPGVPYWDCQPELSLFTPNHSASKSAQLWKETEDLLSGIEAKRK